MNDFINDYDLIEKRSMLAISKILGEMSCSVQELEIIKRTILATADFHYAKILSFKNNPIEAAMSSIRRGRPIITDSKMALCGINTAALDRFGVSVKYIGDGVDGEAAERGITTGMAAMEKAAADPANSGIYVIGTDTTALVKLIELIGKKAVNPTVVIGVPVGFVGVAEVKDELQKLPIPSIVTLGQKGGCGVAVAIVNAISYLNEIDED